MGSVNVVGRMSFPFSARSCARKRVSASAAESFSPGYFTRAIRSPSPTASTSKTRYAGLRRGSSMPRPRSREGRVAARGSVQLHLPLDVVTHRAVPNPVGKINHQPNHKPNHETDPRIEGQKHHHGKIDDDSERRDDKQRGT